ncbi:transporter [Opitutaceae bacterium TAV5]|nr:transporter [Opitutaceae bacterium TAV5]
MEWYYVFNGQRTGPVSQSEFDRLVQTGVITPATLVWRPGMDNWQPWSELAPPGPPALPPLPDTDAEAGEFAVEAGEAPLSAGAGHAGGQAAPFGEPVFPATGTRFAGFWIRLAAKLIDGVCLFALCVVPQLVVIFSVAAALGVDLSQPPSDLSELGPRLLVQMASLVVGTIIGIGYSVFFIRRFDATPGKLAVGIRLVRADGTKLSAGRIIGRYFAEQLSIMTFLVGYIIAGFDGEKRSLHDYICDTRVVFKN